MSEWCSGKSRLLVMVDGRRPPQCPRLKYGAASGMGRGMM
jgi:hypothetical protein